MYFSFFQSVYVFYSYLFINLALCVQYNAYFLLFTLLCLFLSLLLYCHFRLFVFVLVCFPNLFTKKFTVQFLDVANFTEEKNDDHWKQSTEERHVKLFYHCYFKGRGWYLMTSKNRKDTKDIPSLSVYFHHCCINGLLNWNSYSRSSDWAYIELKSPFPTWWCTSCKVGELCSPPPHLPILTTCQTHRTSPGSLLLLFLKVALFCQ